MSIPEYVASELKELETRDADTLYACLIDNLDEMGVPITSILKETLYAEIESQLKMIF